MILSLLTFLHFAALLLSAANAKILENLESLVQTKISNVNKDPNYFNSLELERVKRTGKSSEHFHGLERTSSVTPNLVENNIALSSHHRNNACLLYTSDAADE